MYATARRLLARLIPFILLVATAGGVSASAAIMHSTASSQPEAHMAAAHPARRHRRHRFSCRRGARRHRRGKHHRARCRRAKQSRFRARASRRETAPLTTRGNRHSGSSSSTAGTASTTSSASSTGATTTTSATASPVLGVVTSGGTGGSGSSSAATPSSTSSGTPTSSSADAASAGSIYWGGSIGTQFTGSQPPFDWNAVTDFQNHDAGGKPLSVISWGSPFHSNAWCNGDCSFTTSLYQSVRDQGVIPWISWQSTSDTGESGYTDAEIAAGAQDSYITQWAQTAKAWGHPFFLRFDWEMNGNWFPWGVGVNGNTAADYVAMWRHVHDIFTSVGATNVTWVWCPNIDPGNSMAPLPSLYPGDGYVDWTCVDAYNSDSPWTSFHDLVSSTYNQITGQIAPSKPMFVGETASTESGGSKASWITSLLADLPVSFPKIHGFIWYDDGTYGLGHSDWPLESSSSAQSAFAAGIANAVYATNSFSNLNTAPVPVP